MNTNLEDPTPDTQNDAVQDPLSIQSCSERLSKHHRQRYQWVATAAYFKAEKRDFAPNHDWADWFEAECEYNQTQVEAYLALAEEDGEPTLAGLQRLAHSIGIDYPERFHSKTELIQAIQAACRVLPCFRTGLEEFCNQADTCHWRTQCKKMIASWKGKE